MNADNAHRTTSPAQPGRRSDRPARADPVRRRVTDSRTNAGRKRHTMRKSIIGLTAIAAIAAPIAFATSANAAVTGPYITDFTGVTIDSTPGAIDTWRMTGPYDAAITEGADPALRISNAVTSGSFGDQLFSPTLDVPATETGPARTFTASFVLEPVDTSAGPAGDGQPRQRPGRPGRLPRDRAHGRRHRTWSARGRSSTRQARSTGRSSRWPPGSTRASRTP